MTHNCAAAGRMACGMWHIKANSLKSVGCTLA